MQSITKGSDLVKEESWRVLFKLNVFRLDITKIRACTLELSGKILDSDDVASKTVIVTSSHHFFALFGRASGHIFKKIQQM